MPGMRPIREQTLDQLEGVVWGPPAYPSGLVRTCHRLRTKPVGQFTAEDLRIMLGQQIGLPYLLPLALDRLEASPWAAGDMYPGDLLGATLRARYDWEAAPELRARFLRVIDRALAEVPDLLADAPGDLPDLNLPDPELARELAAELRAARERVG